MALRRETRAQWGAPPDKGKRWVSAATAKTGGVAIHYPGATGSLSRLSHDQCRGLLRQWAAMHMNRGSMFLEYGSLICQHGVWMEGRTTFAGGWLARVGSNGTTSANDNFTSVQLMLGTSDRITDDQKAWLAEAVATLREHGWGDRVTGHRDHYSTACPGDSIYNALPEIRRMADRWKDTGVALTDKDIDRIAEATAARVNRVLGDYNAQGEPVGPNKDNPKLGAVYVRQIKNIALRSRPRSASDRRGPVRRWDDRSDRRPHRVAGAPLLDRAEAVTIVCIATHNIPHRLRPHGASMQELADMGADIICVQENTDSDDWSPRGWKRFRPKRAQSNAIYWNPEKVTPKRRGAKRLSSPGFGSLRYGVWAHFRTPVGPMRVMSVHLPAFYSKPARAAEYDKQAKKVARWAAKRPNRVVAGDFNGSVGGKRMEPLVAVMDFSEPVASGPKGTKIDYVAVAKQGRFRITRTQLGRAGRSDHRPVLVTLEAA